MHAQKKKVCNIVVVRIGVHAIEAQQEEVSNRGTTRTSASATKEQQK
jgi:hypothetical protein